MPFRIAIAAALFAAACGIYAQTAHFDFVNLDDLAYLSDNPLTQRGLSPGSVRWAFSTLYLANYIPLTWLTYFADFQRAELDPGAYHVTNFLFHAANSALVFLALHALTRRTWPSALAAALFAVHPLHVESVAWISERKDVVSTFFGLLALWAYSAYARAPRFRTYALVFALLACSLLAKPMLVTFPFLFLVLDYWPLDRAKPRRSDRRIWLRLSLEKLPLFGLAAAASYVAILAQRDANALPPSDFLGWAPRLANAAMSYIRYLAMTAFPQGLIPYYPHPHTSLPPWHVAGAAAALAAISIGAWLGRARAPYLLAGWLWYLGTLVPVIGLVQVGGQAMADRYTYVPLAGIFISVAWTLAGIVTRYPRTRIPACAASLTALALLTGLAHAQTSRWRDSITLYEYTLTVDPRNPIALPNLGEAYLQARRYEDAVRAIERALQAGPSTSGSHANLGLALRKLGRTEEAELHMREAVRLDPSSAKQRNNLALVLMDFNRLPSAQAELEQAFRLDPAYLGTFVNLGNLLMREGNFLEAESRYREALDRDPHDREALRDLDMLYRLRTNYGQAIVRSRLSPGIVPIDATTRKTLAAALFAEAESLYRAALDGDPRNADALSNLGALHLLRKEYSQAEALSREALAIAPDDAIVRTNLAIALMELGDRAGAHREAEAALRADPAYAAARALLEELGRRGAP